MHIAVIGPANPDEFASDLESVDVFPRGMGGIPVNGLVRSLLDLGHRVSLFTASPGQDVVWRAHGARLSIVAVPFRMRARDRALDFFHYERRAIARELSTCDAEVFHAHWTYEFALACIDARVAPLLVTAHDAPFMVLRHMPDSYRLIRAMMAVRARTSIKNLIAGTPYLAARWRKEMFFKRAITIIPNPVPQLDLPSVPHPDHPVILDVANASNLKNVKTLLSAFSLVKRELPSSELRLVGSGLGPDEVMESWAVENGLASGVVFLGVLDRTAVARHYAEATVFCHTSREEAQPMCLLEAMSARLPIVAGARSGGVSWTLFDGKASRLVDINCPEDIASALFATIADPKLSVQRADELSRLVNERYAPGVIAAQYIAEYERVIAGHLL